MIKTYNIFVVNNKTSKGKDVVVYAYSAEQARYLFEDCCLKDNETILTVYPRYL